jgi:DNA-binding beta-propeller fold protein YncE
MDRMNRIRNKKKIYPAYPVHPCKFMYFICIYLCSSVVKFLSVNSVLSVTKISFLLFIALFFGGCSAVAPVNVERKPLAVVQTLAGVGEVRFGEVFGVAVGKNGVVFVSDGANGKIWRVEKDGKPALVTDKLDTPSHIVFNKDGQIIVADAGSHTIKQINPANGEVKLLAGVENQSGFADGAASAALFNAPVGVAVDQSGKVFVADTYNDKIRVIENGQVRTVAGTEQGFADGVQAKFNTPCGIAVDKDGAVLVADVGNRRIRKIDAGGNVSTLGGTGERNTRDGWGWEAEFVEPAAVTVDEKGVVYVADAGANAIRVFGRDGAPLWQTFAGGRRGLVDAELKNVAFNRPNSIAFDAEGRMFIADSANKTVRAALPEFQSNLPKINDSAKASELFISANTMREQTAPRWTYDPPANPREIAGTFGEVRGSIKQPADFAYFHNGLDIVGGYGETARFVRAEKVLRPVAVDNFATLRELLRTPLFGYVHINIGREASGTPFNDARFLFQKDEKGRMTGVRVRRGTRFEAGEPIGTLNAMNHVHLTVGETGAEMNALAALNLPGVTDTVAPRIEKITVFNEAWQEIKPNQPASGKIRIVAKAFDQMDGNAARRRLGVFRLGYQVLQSNDAPAAGFDAPKMNISFERLPENDAANLVFAPGSQSGATGETVFNYLVTNVVRDGAAREELFDTATLPNGDYKIRVTAADFFGNQATQEISVKIAN